MKPVDGINIQTYFQPEMLQEQLNQEITISACIHRIRKMSEFAFVILRTGRYLIQCIYENSRCGYDLDTLKEGYFIKCTGLVKKSDKAYFGYEILLNDLQLLSQPKEEYPLKVSQKSIGCALEVNLDHRSVALRNPKERAVFKIAEGVTTAFSQFLLKEGFTQVNTPKIVSAGAEGGANIFSLEYFDQQAFLAQSPQFYKQTCVAFYDRVFEINPVYRAEKHNTSRHLNEYIGLDFEMGFIDSMYDIMDMETAVLKYIIAYLQIHYQYELTLLEAKLPTIDAIPAITFMEGMEILGYARAKADLDPEDEVKLCEYSLEKYGTEFIFITHFPSAKRPFYAMNDPEDVRFALSFDLLFRGLEITTGGQRIHDYDEQVAKLKKYGIEAEELASYLSVHKYGLPPHGGLGIGLERLVMKLLGLSNIRMASLFPRDVNRLDP